MDASVVLLGFAVGVLVGLTGIGGGALMTPLLILTGWVRPVVAVGTALVWATLTKAVGAVTHYRQGTVDLALVRRLAWGSIPGGLVGVVLLARLRSVGDEMVVDEFVIRALGITLMGVAVSLMLRPLWSAGGPASRRDTLRGKRQQVLTTLTGAVIGFLVGVTSVGSGSLMVACLLVLYPRAPLGRIVGSDIFHAVFLVGVAGLGHWQMGSVNGPLMSALLVGSLPGVWLGSKLSAAFPERILRPIVVTALFGMGYKLL